MRHLRTLLLCLCAAPGLLASSAVAEMKNWGTSGEWSIEIDEAAENGCLMTRALESGHVVEIGFLPARNEGFLAVYHADWTHVTEGMEAFWEFRFEGSRFGGQAVAVFRDDLAGGAAFFDNPGFIDDISGQNFVMLVPKETDPIEISLRGTMAASREVKACQDAQGP